MTPRRLLLLALIPAFLLVACGKEEPKKPAAGDPTNPFADEPRDPANPFDPRNFDENDPFGS